MEEVILSERGHALREQETMKRIWIEIRKAGHKKCNTGNTRRVEYAEFRPKIPREHSGWKHNENRFLGKDNKAKGNK